MRLLEKRKNPTAPSRTSSVVGVLLLLLLPVILGAVVWKGQRFDPSLYYQELAGKAAVIPPEVLQPILDAGFTADGDPETFTPDTLYYKIDGNAPAYHAFGFVELLVGSYTSGGDEPTEVYIYDMAEVQNAFGIYSQEKPSEAEFMKLGTEGYRVGSSIRFSAGRYYVKLNSVETGGEAAERSLAAARAVLAVLPGVDAAGSGPSSAFPEENLKPDSLQFVKSDALGLSFLSNTMMATYVDGEQEQTAYYTTDGSPAAKFETYLTYAREMGDVIDDATGSAGRVAVIDVFGVKELIMATDKVFCGVQPVEDVEAGKARLASLAERAGQGGSQ